MPKRAPKTSSFALREDGEDVVVQLEQLDARLRDVIADSDRLNALVEAEMVDRGDDDYSAALGYVLAVGHEVRRLVEAMGQPDTDRERVALEGAAMLRALREDEVTLDEAMRDLEGGDDA